MLETLSHLSSKARLFLNGAMMTCALLAIAVKALIPAGFMLAPGQQDQLLAIVMCTGSGSQTLYMAQDGQIYADPNVLETDSTDGDPSKDHNKPNGDHPCTFASHHSLALAQHILPNHVVGFMPHTQVATSASYDQVPGRGLAAPPPPATASPLLI
jgi:hypothetical protein